MVRNSPRNAATPIMADEVKAAMGMAARGHNVHGVGDQPVEVVVGNISRVRPCAGRIAALARRYRPISRRRQGGQLRPPHME